MRDTDTGEPVVAAVVTVRDTAGAVVRRAETTRSGQFVISLPRPGRYRVGAERIGYGAAESNRVFEVRAGEVLDLDLTLSTEPVAVEAVVATARSRRARESVVRGTPLRLLDRPEIEDLEAHNGVHAVKDVMRHFPGVRVVEYRDSNDGWKACIEVQRKAAAGCAGALIVVDGTPVSNGDLLAYNMPSLDVESIEVLRASEAGLRFGTLAGRGVVLINTRGSGPWSRRHAAAIPVEQRDIRELIFAGVASAAAGIVVGSLTSCLTYDCPFGEMSRPAGAMEASALTLAIPLGVHVTGGRRSSLPLQALIAAGVGAAGYVAWSATDSKVAIVLTPVLQVAAAVAVERRTGRR